MAYDEDLAMRVRETLADMDLAADERKMFGGLAFMMRGHMTVGILGDELLVRVGKDAHDDAIARPHTRVFDFTGRPSAGMVYVAPAGVATDDDLAAWIQRGLDFTSGLPAK